MTYIYIGGILVVAVLIGIACLAISRVSGSVGISIRNKTLSLMSEYDRMLENKSAELEKLNAQLEEKREALKEFETTEKDKVTPSDDAAGSADVSFAVEAVERAVDQVYFDRNLAEKYQRIKDSFDVVDDFDLDGLPTKKMTDNEMLSIKFLNEVSLDTLYKLSTLESMEQFELLRDVTKGEFDSLLEEYAGKKESFKALEFYDFIKEKAENCGSGTIVKVGRGKKPDALPDNVQVVIDPDILEGYQIIHNNILYDYAIKGRELS